MFQESEPIRSRANALVKRARAVLRGREEGAILLEGERLVFDALEARIEIESVLLREDRQSLAAVLESAGLPAARLRLVAPSTFDTLSSVRTSPGVVAVAARPPHRELAALEALLDAGTATSGPEGALVLGIAGIQDPGNLGALARAAEAAGARALLVAPEGARPFGPKALRGSMGSLLRLPVFELERLAVGVAAMEARGCRQYVAATRGGEPIASLAGAEPCCIWMTSETGDLPGELSAVRRVTIPMRGRVESLNVTVAGALLLFAAGGALS